MKKLFSIIVGRTKNGSIKYGRIEETGDSFNLDWLNRNCCTESQVEYLLSEVVKTNISNLGYDGEYEPDIRWGCKATLSGEVSLWKPMTLSEFNEEFKKPVYIYCWSNGKWNRYSCNGNSRDYYYIELNLNGYISGATHIKFDEDSIYYNTTHDSNLTTDSKYKNVQLDSTVKIKNENTIFGKFFGKLINGVVKSVINDGDTDNRPKLVYDICSMKFFERVLIHDYHVLIESNRVVKNGVHVIKNN